MPAPLHSDLRWRAIIQIIYFEISLSRVARLNCVSERTIKRWLALFEKTGDVEPKLIPGRNPILAAEHLIILKELVLSNPTDTLIEIQCRLVIFFFFFLSFFYGFHSLPLSSC
jgi:transposase